MEALRISRKSSCSLVFQAGCTNSEGCSCMRKACKGVLFESMSGRVGDLCWSRGCGADHQGGRISSSLIWKDRGRSPGGHRRRGRELWRCAERPVVRHRLRKSNRNLPID